MSAMETMRAAVFERVGRLAVRERPVPPLQRSYDVVLDV